MKTIGSLICYLKKLTAFYKENHESSKAQSVSIILNIIMINNNFYIYSYIIATNSILKALIDCFIAFPLAAYHFKKKISHKANLKKN
jgi:hypothetical protein